ncbi:MAG: 16S rRNA (cytidine(1402)-2'-O)-methyltransferase [Chloroflexota bacterium]
MAKSKEKSGGKLFIVSTPIGNKEDITLRAIRTLEECDLVVCEEIKEGAKILRTINISKELDNLNEQNEEQKAGMYVEMLREGTSIAVISDAGTPVIADPGLTLVRAALAADIDIEVVPGTTSMMTALVRSGFSTKRFLFAGFLSRKPSERSEELEKLAKVPDTVIMLDTPYRLNTLLRTAAQIMPDRRAYLGLNLTMPFETHHYGTFAELAERFAEKKLKAEFVICFEGAFGETVDAYADTRTSAVIGRDEEFGEIAQTRKYALDAIEGDDIFSEIDSAETTETGKRFADFEAEGEENKPERERAPGREHREGDRRNYNRGGDRREGGERRSYGDKREGGERRDNRGGDRRQGANRYGDKREGGERRSYGDNREGGERRNYGDKREGGERRSYGDKREGGERRSYGDKREGGERRDSRGGNRGFNRSAEPEGGERNYNDIKYNEKSYQESKPYDRPQRKPYSDDRRQGGGRYSDNRGERRDSGRRDDRGAGRSDNRGEGRSEGREEFRSHDFERFGYSNLANRRSHNFKPKTGGGPKKGNRSYNK